MEKKLYEMDLKKDCKCSFEDELDGKEGRFINVDDDEGFHKVWYDPQGYYDKLVQEFNDYSYQIREILERGIMAKDLGYLLKLDVKIFNIFYELTCTVFDYSCFDLRDYGGAEEIRKDEYNFYFDDDEYKNLRLF